LGLVEFAFETDASGSIIEWGIEVTGLGGEVIVSNLFDIPGVSSGNGDEAAISGSVATNSGSPGTWASSTGAATTPEPTSLVLVGSGLLGLAVLTRRRFLWPSTAQTQAIPLP